MSTSTTDDYNLARILAGELTLPHITELIRRFQLRHELLADGMFGPATKSRLDELMRSSLGNWGIFDGPIDVLPRTHGDYYKVYGNPGAGKLNQDWYRANIVELHQTHANELPVVPAWQYVHLHRLVEPYMREALRRAQTAAPDYAIERFGSFNFRHQRHDSRRKLSTHAFGAACDIDPPKNHAVRFAPGKKPEPFSPAWHRTWPDGVPKEIVEAFLSVGFSWGGDWLTYIDPMHFQLG